jgi:hypothetical protein
MKLKIGDRFINITGLPGTVCGAYETGSIKIDKELGVRNICDLTVWHRDPAIRYQKGLPVKIFSDTDELLFAGFVETAKMHREADSFYHDLAAIDYRYLADKRIVVYSRANANAGTIARELFNAYLQAEDCTIGEIQEGPIISETVFNYISLNRCLDRLAESVGFFWRIDNQKRFYFVARATYEAPWSLTYLDVNGTPRIENKNLQYRNTQYVLESKNITSEQEKFWQGDGVNRTFVVDYPIAKTPKIEVSYSGSPYVQETIGIRGIKEDEADKQWLWNKNDKIVTHNKIYPALTVNDTAHIVYQGFEDIVVKVSDFEAIDSMKAVEGFGSGIVEEVIRRPDLGTVEAAFEAANEELEKNTQVGDSITFTTKRPGLEPGQMLPINLPRYDLNDTFLIEKVTIQEEVRGLVWYEVTASKGTMYESWTKMFTKMFFANEPLIILENISEKEFIRLLIDFTKIWLEEERPNLFNVVFPGDAVYPADDLYPMFDYQNRVRYVAAIDAEGNEMGRKAVTSISGMTGDDINSRFFIADDEFNGDIKQLAWFGGMLASAESGSGVEIDRQTYEHTKTALEALQIQRRDIKGW